MEVHYGRSSIPTDSRNFRDLWPCFANCVIMSMDGLMETNSLTATEPSIDK